MKQILLIEDDKGLSRGLKVALEKDDISVHVLYTISEAKKVLKSSNEPYNLIILDINLPDGNGLIFLQWIKSISKTPVLILTSNDMETDIVEGFELGCDDYVTKPFSLMVLRARVMSIVNRGSINKNITKFGDFIFDFEKFEFYKKGVKVILSISEQKLLKKLTANTEQILTKNQLMDGLWGIDSEFVSENALSVTIKRLRHKLEDDPANPKYIRTVYGLGYMWTGGDE